MWYLGPIPLRAYALCIIVGIIAAMWLTLRRYRARGGSEDMVWDAAIVAIPAGIIGGRLYHVITHWQDYFGPGTDPLGWLKVWEGGLAIMGAVFLGGLATWGFFRFRGVPLAPFADALAPGIILAQAIGRLGNWFNQELYGRPTDVPWALDLYYRVDEAGRYAPLTGTSTGDVMASVHPTFLYEMLWNLAVFGFLLWADRKFQLGHGRVFAAYAGLYAVGRFGMEFMRTDPANEVFGLRVNAFAALVIVIGAAVVFALLPRGREHPRKVRGAEASAEDAAAAGAESTESGTNVTDRAAFGGENHTGSQ